jgi:hypothetical protein
MSQDPVQLQFHLPPLDGDPARLGALLRALEALLPGAQLDWRAERPEGEDEDDGERWMQGAGVRLVRMADRERWLAQQLGEGRDVLLFSGAPYTGLSVSAMAGSTPVRSGGAVGSAAVRLTPGTLCAELLPRLLAVAGDALGAWWAEHTPLTTAGELVQVQRVSPTRRSAGRERLLARTPALAGLPLLPGGTTALPVPEAPLTLGWLNYWSEATARWLGFPDASRDAEWLARSDRTPAGAWVWRVTEEPLALAHPGHAEALVRAYARFARVAARS